MPGAYISHAGTADYFMLLHPRADGPVLGTYAGRPIAATIIDADGRRYFYAGVAPRLSNGRYDLGALRADEWLVEPGLVYCGERAKATARLERL